MNRYRVLFDVVVHVTKDYEFNAESYRREHGWFKFYIGEDVVFQANEQNVVFVRTVAVKEAGDA